MASLANLARQLAEIGRDHQPRVWPGAPVVLTWTSSGRTLPGVLGRVAAPDSDGVVREALVTAGGITYRVTRRDRVDAFSFPQFAQPGTEADAFTVSFPSGPGAAPPLPTSKATTTTYVPADWLALEPAP